MEVLLLILILLLIVFLNTTACGAALADAELNAACEAIHLVAARTQSGGHDTSICQNDSRHLLSARV